MVSTILPRSSNYTSLPCRNSYRNVRQTVQTAWLSVWSVSWSSSAILLTLPWLKRPPSVWDRLAPVTSGWPPCPNNQRTQLCRKPLAASRTSHIYRNTVTYFISWATIWWTKGGKHLYFKENRLQINLPFTKTKLRLYLLSVHSWNYFAT